MGLSDEGGGALKGALGGAGAAAGPSLITTLLAQTNLGGLQGIVAKLQESGLGKQVASWLSTGTNLPISAEQLQAALGNEHVREIAGKLGLPIDGALKVLAEHLPTTVDQASPDGTLPPAA